MTEILTGYKQSFDQKAYSEENNDLDLLMHLFGITPALKRENRQYWGRELGKCWELLMKSLFENCCEDYSPPYRDGQDEPADFFVGKEAIDTKYRIGSGDSGTLKKLESYGVKLISDGYQPIMLLVREDNLPAAISKCRAGGWRILTGNDTFEYIMARTKFDFASWILRQTANKTFKINR